jgi:hypothetical protein
VLFRSGYFGASHQHEDKLNFVYYAGGRELIGDPGIYSYNSNEFEHYWRGSWSHNTVRVDGLSQPRCRGPAEEIPDPDRRFVMGDGFDFALGWYRHAYSPRQGALWGGGTTSDRDAALRGVEHQRCVLYLKGRYAVICDRVIGEGEHQLDFLFHPAPIIRGEGIYRTARAVQLELRPDGAAVTTEPDHANVAILPARRDLQALTLSGQKDPARGWFALFGIVPSPDLIYRRRTTLPYHSETVIQPLPPGRSEPLTVRAVEVQAEPGKACTAVACGRDLLLLCYDGPAEMACEGVQFTGTALLLTRSADGRASTAHMVDGERLMLDSREVFAPASASPSATVSI